MRVRVGASGVAAAQWVHVVNYFRAMHRLESEGVDAVQIVDYAQHLGNNLYVNEVEDEILM